MLDYVRLILKIVIFWLLSLYFVYINSTNFFICDSRFKWFQPFSSHQYSRPKKTPEKHVDFLLRQPLCWLRLAQKGPKFGVQKLFLQIGTSAPQRHPNPNRGWHHQISPGCWGLNPEPWKYYSQGQSTRGKTPTSNHKLANFVLDLMWPELEEHPSTRTTSDLPCATKKPVRRYISPCWHSMRAQWPKCTHWLCAPPKNERNNSKVYRNLSNCTQVYGAKWGVSTSSVTYQSIE